jgi:putative ABC transport system substrate-binding protein
VKRREFIAVIGGAAVAWPVQAIAQQKAMPVIGFLGSASPGSHAPFVAGFQQGLSGTGYVEGQNVVIEYRWAEGRFDRLPVLAADLVSRQVAVILAQSDVAALAAKSTTSRIPIIFIAGNPVGTGLVASLARPGDNITGVSLLTTDLMAKRFELLSELVPQARVIALLVNPGNPNAELMSADAQEAARSRMVQLPVLKAASDHEIDAAFATLANLRAAALVVAADPFFTSRRERLVTLASAHAIPAVYEWREFAEAGGLISYGSSITSVYRQAGIYVGKILNGAKPADLPVQQPTAFELVINLKAAKALSLAVPQALLARADEVIE